MEPARAQRLKRAALRAMDDPKAGGIGGLLYQAGLLDEAQIEAGTLFGLLARKLAVLTGLPLPTAKASSPERIGGTGSGREASDGLLARVKEDYAIAVDTLGRTRRAVERVFVLDTRPRDGEICLVREGTRALAALWLTGEGNQPIVCGSDATWQPGPSRLTGRI
ncbi:MAG: hypothetical protein D6773_15395 [Alphaproteobacteria bacterium]|nr:MAG: hypothetical protein D6773_15395 [Alphaproteobacteria bacterium]